MNCPQCGTTRHYLWTLVPTLALGSLFVAYSLLLLNKPIGCQQVAEVQPSMPLAWVRLPWHLAFLFLMCVTVVTDFLDYIIADEVIIVGCLLGAAGAFLSGELQIIHIWVNWDHELPGVYGPYLPEWIKHHQHLHGIAWSMAGLVTGASLTWLVRWMAHTILGQSAMGLGDVTLMAMIGSFVGWQPTLCILAIAPLTGVAIGLINRMVTGRSFVAFGPYLVSAAVIVLCTWRWLWADYFRLRDIFSHWPTILGLIAASLVVLLILLSGIRLYRSLPAEKLRH
jgi:leader peptidase (prepilin peptidase)/N-methyltransferase